LLSKLKDNGSRLSLGTKRTPSGEEIPTVGSEHPEQLDHIGENTPLQDGPVDGEEELQQEEMEEDSEQWGPPTTLLAELQVRKAHQKTRNRTAATAFPNGMHSTLLQLDAVAQIEKKKRQGQRVALAWEDSDAVDAANHDDEDVPLGVLFPNRKGLINEIDKSRPLGLMERRELEDNEPLSRRRNRLRGGDTGPVRGGSPSKNQSTLNLTMPNASQIHLGGASPQPASTPNAAATPGAKTPEDAEQHPASEAFALDLLNDLGIKPEDTKPPPVVEPPKPQPTPDSENETLGQRRTRLQAEARSRQASGNTITGADAPPQARPALKTTRSMADLLASHPVGPGPGPDGTRKPSNDQPLGGGLLAKSQVRQDAKKRNLIESNRRSSTFGLGRPLVEVSGPADTYAALKAAPFMGGVYNTGAGATATAASTPGMMMGGVSGADVGGQRGGYFPQQQQQQQHQRAQSYNYGSGMGMATHMAQSNPNLMMAGMPTPTPMSMAGTPGAAAYGYGAQMPYQQPAMNGMGMSQMYDPMAVNVMQMQMQMQMQMSGMGMQNGIHGHGINMGMGMGVPNGMSGSMSTPGQMPLGMGEELPMEAKRRALIDRWRQSIL